MRYLILLMFLMACGADHEGGITLPTSNELPPPEPVEGMPEVIEFEDHGEVGTRNLYNAKEIHVFYGSMLGPFYDHNYNPTYKDFSFEELLNSCVITAKYHYIDPKDVGVLSVREDEGFTLDFLLNPDVDRTYKMEDMDHMNIRQRIENFGFAIEEYTRTTRTREYTAERRRTLCGYIQRDSRYYVD